MRPQLVMPSLKSSLATELISLMSSPLSSKFSFTNIPGSRRHKCYNRNQVYTFIHKEIIALFLPSAWEHVEILCRVVMCRALTGTSYCSVAYNSAPGPVLSTACLYVHVNTSQALSWKTEYKVSQATLGVCVWSHRELI